MGSFLETPMTDQPLLPEMPSPKGRGPRRPDRRTRAGKSVQKGRLRVHDPFELVRWLALSQPDPRKALAELVQNALDAQATYVEVVRYRKKGIACLEIRDNGVGVIPEFPRDEALRHMATNIGHSRKRSLTPRERLELMTQGQYGIGLLGFWSLGQTLEVESWRTKQERGPEGEDQKKEVNDQQGRPHRLTLHRNRRDWLIEPLRRRKAPDLPSTVVRIVGIHDDALRVLTARRASVYLGSELRGQLLAREVELWVHDRMARGRAPRRLAVEARRFTGTPLEVASVPVPGYPDVQLDLYLVEKARSQSPVSLYAAGTLVAESFGELAPLSLNRRPWTDPRLTGVVEFPALSVAAGSRRGVLPDAASAAFCRALESVTPRIEFLLAEEEERREEELDRSLVRNLQKAFRGISSSMERFALLPVEDGSEGPPAPGGSEAQEEQASADESDEATEAVAGEAEGRAVLETPAFTTTEAPLSESAPTGALHEVRIEPSRLRLRPGAARIVRARAFDADGRLIGGRVDYLWRLVDLPGEVEELPSLGSKVRVRAQGSPTAGSLRVVACQGDHRATAEIPVELLEPRPERAEGSEGVPEPELVGDSGALWRSRVRAGRWQVNSAHPSWSEVASQPALKLRYLALLYAKEVVVATHRDPRLAEPLEELVDIFGYADRNLAR